MTASPPAAQGHPTVPPRRPARGRPVVPPPRVEQGRPVPPPARFQPAPTPPPVHMGRPLGPVRPIYVEVAPPPVRYEVRSPRPSHDHVWIGGYWAWQNGVQVWMGGEWVTPPQPGYRWVPARWKRHGHRWVYYPGYWKHRHGPMFVAPVVSAPAPVYAALTISGHVITIDGMPVPGVVVTLAGTQEGQSVTDGRGYYIFAGLPPGSYAVRPSAGGCAFAPDVANLGNLAGDVAQDIIVTGCPGW